MFLDNQSIFPQFDTVANAVGHDAVISQLRGFNPDIGSYSNVFQDCLGPTGVALVDLVMCITLQISFSMCSHKPVWIHGGEVNASLNSCLISMFI